MTFPETFAVVCGSAGIGILVFTLVFVWLEWLTEPRGKTVV